MQITRLALLFLAITSIYGYPTKPLDERSTELAWEAWLLVQNNETDGITRKKVVPKSVFIAPEFDRPCPDGMQKDITGKCFRVHGLDNDGQLDFLFAKLSGHLNANKSDEVQNQATPGPAQIHIPIPLRAAESIDEIVDGLTILDPSKVVKEEDETNPATVAPPTTTMQPSTETATTSIITDLSTQQETEASTQTSTLPTTTWFTTESPTVTPTPAEEQDYFTTTIQFPPPILETDSSTTETPQDTEGTTSSTTFGFGDEGEEAYYGHTDISPILFRLPLEVPERQAEVIGTPTIVFKEDDVENVRQAVNFIRFPDETYESYRRPQRDQHYFNHRNRDKNIWKFNPPWRETPDSTLILVPKVANNNDVDFYKKLLHEQLSYFLRKNR